MVSESDFGAFFQEQFFLCGVAPNHLGFGLWLVEVFFFSRMWGLVWGFWLLRGGCTLCFGGVAALRCQQLQMV